MNYDLIKVEILSNNEGELQKSTHKYFYISINLRFILINPIEKMKKQNLKIA